MGKVYTKTGDKGNTTLYGGSPISKGSPRVRTYGAVDEANVAIGIAKVELSEPLFRDLLEIIQLRLFEVAAEIASDEEGRKKLTNNVQEADVVFLEKVIDELTKDLDEKPYFMIPGKSRASAALHGARVAVRRAERELTDLGQEEPPREPVRQYLNRLSDLLYILSRYVDEKEPTATSHKDLGPAMEKACREKAKELGKSMAVALVDGHGSLLRFSRMEGTLPISTQMAMDKAYTAAVLRMSTRELGELAGEKGPLFGIENSPRVVVFAGGLPLTVDGKIVGAIGVSGGTPEEDEAVALAGAELFQKLGG